MTCTFCGMPVVQGEVCPRCLPLVAGPRPPLDDLIAERFNLPAIAREGHP